MCTDFLLHLAELGGWSVMPAMQAPGPALAYVNDIHTILTVQPTPAPYNKS